MVAGSHRLLNGQRLCSRETKRRLSREPYFRDLTSAKSEDRGRFTREPGRVGDIEVRVVELTGRPGDVYLMDMRVLHAAAPNASRVPRMMAAHRFLLGPARDGICRAGAGGGPAEV